MKKLLLFIGIITTSFLLIACDDIDYNDNGNEQPDVLTIEDLKVALQKFDDKNYELKVVINYYNQTEATLYIRVDGDITHFIINEDNDEYYVRDGRNLLAYIKDGNKYYVETINERQNKELLLFNNLDENWFEIKDDIFVLEATYLPEIKAIVNLGDDYEIDAVKLELSDDGTLSFLEIKLDRLGYVYYYRFNVGKYGEVSLELPEVNEK